MIDTYTAILNILYRMPDCTATVEQIVESIPCSEEETERRLKELCVGHPNTGYEPGIVVRKDTIPITYSLAKDMNFVIPDHQLVEYLSKR